MPVEAGRRYSNRSNKVVCRLAGYAQSRGQSASIADPRKLKFSSSLQVQLRQRLSGGYLSGRSLCLLALPVGRKLPLAACKKPRGWYLSDRILPRSEEHTSELQSPM